MGALLKFQTGGVVERFVFHMSGVCRKGTHQKHSFVPFTATRSSVLKLGYGCRKRAHFSSSLMVSCMKHKSKIFIPSPTSFLPLRNSRGRLFGAHECAAGCITHSLLFHNHYTPSYQISIIKIYNQLE